MLNPVLLFFSFNESNGNERNAQQKTEQLKVIYVIRVIT